MLEISKAVANKLHTKHGIRFKDGGISSSTTKSKKFYLCESEYNLRKLFSLTKDDRAEQLLKDIKKRKEEEKKNTY